MNHANEVMGKRYGALSILTGIAANRSIASGLPVTIGSLVTLKEKQVALEITEERLLYGDSYLVMNERSFVDRSGRTRRWSYVKRKADQGAVVVVPVTCESRSIIVIRQFRVPFGRALIEFPAGLIDDGEDPADAALRELEEETGYRGRILSMGPPTSTSAGLTTELVRMVFVETDENPLTDRKAGPENSEEIEVIRIQQHDMADALRRWEVSGELLDIKLYLYFQAHCGA